MTLTKRLLYQLSYIGTRKKRIRAAAIVLDTTPPKQSLKVRPGAQTAARWGVFHVRGSLP